MEVNTMLYKSDFETEAIKMFIDTDVDKDAFSVIITKNTSTGNITQHSLVVAAKPLVYFATVFGSRLIRYTKHDITRVNFLSKLYTLSIVSAMAALMLVNRPVSWLDTRSDVPLNILTKTFGLFNISEALYSVFIVTFGNSKLYVELFEKIEDVDRHYRASKLAFIKRRIMSIFLILLSTIQVSCTFWLRKFQIENMGAHLTFFLLMLQGVILYFFIVNIFTHQLMLNNLLANKILGIISNRKKTIYQDSKYSFIFKKIFTETKIVDRNMVKRYCWFELMQMYDELADCVQLFNHIYCGQIFLMYNTWLLCTLLIICRSLSPSIKYSELFLSDLFLYSCINARPIILAGMCEFFIRERKRTLSILVQILLNGVDEGYYDQVQTMIMLVASRRLEISANVFTVNVPTVMNFAGRIISYTVLMIQYFYMRVFLK